jgi:hypothetical protein
MPTCSKCGFNAQSWSKLCPRCGNSLVVIRKTAKNNTKDSNLTNKISKSKKLGKKQILNYILCGILLISIGLGLIYFSCHGDTKYYARAGSPGGGVEGERDAAGPIFYFGLLATLFGVMLIVLAIKREPL